MTVTISRAVLDSAAGMSVEARDKFLKLYADGQGISFSEIQKALEKRAEAAKKAEAKKAKLKELRALRSEVETAAAEFDYYTLESLRPKVEKAGGRLVFTGVSNGDPVISLEGMAETSGRGGARPKNDAPQPYVDTNGDRVIGPVSAWVRENFADTFENELSDEDGKPIQNFIKRAIKAGVIERSPLD